MLFSFVRSDYDFIDVILFAENVVLYHTDCNMLILYLDAILAC